MASAYLGIDIGTSSCKALLMAPDGSVIASATEGYGIQIPRDGWSEQNPEDWVAGAAQAVGAALGAADAEVLCVGLSGQMHGMTALSSGHKVLRPAILWNDQRNQAECDEITELAGGLDPLLRMTGNRMLPGFTGGKIRWFQKNEAKLFGQARKILNPKDYVRLRLTGELATEVSDASGTGLFDVAQRQWSAELLGLAGIDRDLLPTCFESDAVSGSVSEAGAALFGIPRGTPVVGGGGDAVVQTLGSGIAEPGTMQTTIGTAGIVAVALPAPLSNPDGRLQVSCNVAGGLWHCMGVSLNAGGALAWLRAALYGSNGNAPDFGSLVAQAADIGIGADGLLFLPYLMGERCPHPDPHARGAFVGLRAQHTSAHIVRSVLEGIIYALYDIAALMEQAGLPHAAEVRTSGGGTSSELWNQVQADVFNAEVAASRSAAEGGAYGAAMLAGVGAGNWSSAAEAAQICRTEGRWKPIAANHRAYGRLFGVYETLYDQLKEANSKLSAIAAGKAS